VKLDSDRGGMVWVPGGSFTMGSDSHYPEEAPTGRIEVGGFWMDRHAVTAGQFNEFVAETGYTTVAERAPDPAMYPGADPSMLVPGSLTFAMPDGPVDMADPSQWWRWTPGASWRAPWGPGTSLEGKFDHPATQVSWEDAAAYADWAGKRLPSESEWERAARGGLDEEEFPWGSELSPEGEEAMNRWIGRFPWEWIPPTPDRTGPDTRPVGSFEPNGFGLYDMTGNVWEWTSTWFVDAGPVQASCCGSGSPPGDRKVDLSREPGSGIPRKVLKGGSFLCAENYCSRYRPAARIPQTVESATCHTGFRCVTDA
jgi:formylglycine-generating enzyme required for sulfatase activity